MKDREWIGWRVRNPFPGLVFDLFFRASGNLCHLEIDVQERSTSLRWATTTSTAQWLQWHRDQCMVVVRHRFDLRIYTSHVLFLSFSCFCFPLSPFPFVSFAQTYECISCRQCRESSIFGTRSKQRTNVSMGPRVSCFVPVRLPASILMWGFPGSDE